MRLFWEKGFSAVSLPELEERTGLSRSSLYNSFGSKQEIFDQALERYRRAAGDEMCRPLEAGDRGLDDLFEFLDAVAGQCSSQAGVSGCLLVNSMVEFGGTDDAVTRHGSRHMERLRRALTATLKRAVALGEIRQGNLAGRADLILGLMLGINAAARADLPPAEINALVAAARGQVKEWRKIAARRHQ